MVTRTMHRAGYDYSVKFFFIALAAIILNACSMGQMVARSSLPIVESGNVAMNRETDLDLARAAIPANLKLIEGLIQELPGNADLRLQAAQGFYGYAYGFVEDEDSRRASGLYRRGWEHARQALVASGFQGDLAAMTTEELKLQLAELGRRAVPALFWTASCWAKWIDMNRNDPARIADMGKAAALMERVIELDENYYHGGAHLFFGVFYGAKPPMFGGDFERSARHFEKARAVTQGKLLLADMLRAQYLARQQLDRQQFHERLLTVIKAPSDLFPEMALANAIAKQKARQLLAKEEEWF
ncbi:MAG: hypothetical protein HY082_10830 [Gammaproteobacteria bacterium]|nr:hypothetical protein [Gammaproteobacteria bacterium]